MLHFKTENGSQGGFPESVYRLFILQTEVCRLSVLRKNKRKLCVCKRTKRNKCTCPSMEITKLVSQSESVRIYTCIKKFRLIFSVRLRLASKYDCMDDLGYLSNVYHKKYISWK
jgi:hypothetical protein